MGLAYAQGDLSFYHLTEKAELQGILAVYVDHMLSVGNVYFIKLTTTITRNSIPKQNTSLHCYSLGS